MIGPLDLMSDHAKERLIDGGLTKLADASERTGLKGVAHALRRLRGDTPFIEDVSAGLARAVKSFEAEWALRDPELTGLLINEPALWSSSEFLSNLTAALLRPTVSGTDVEYQAMRGIMLSAVAGRASDARVDAALAFLVSKVRDELFAHPKLQSVHALFLQLAAVEGQNAILQELRAIRRDNVSMADDHMLSTGMRTPRMLGPAVPEASAQSRPTLMAAGSVPDPGGMPLPDVLTPSLDGRLVIEASYTPVVGPGEARWLADVQSRLTQSVEDADFRRQQGIARDLLENSFGVKKLEVSAHYMLGESLRLQADFADGDVVRTKLLNDARESYATAFDLDGSSARAVRGLARIEEVVGNTGGALSLYSRSRAIALHAFVEAGDMPDGEAAHEVLRSTRHYASCLAQAARESPHGTYARQGKLLQLHGLILESEDLHRSILPRFAADAKWMHIEWFMGLVLLAKAYTAVGDLQRAWLSLVHALAARMEMMNPSALGLSRVERGNLLWWCAVADLVVAPTQDFQHLVEFIRETVVTGDVPAIWMSMEEVVRPIRPPWAVLPERV